VDLETTLGGGRILADPELLPNWGKTELSVLPLLFDRLLLPNPDQDRVASWGFDPDQLNGLVSEGIVVPIVAGEEPLESFPPNSQITRFQLLPNEEFYALYQRAVAADMEDTNFDPIVKELSRAIGRTLPIDHVAFDANWDFLLSLRLHAPVAGSAATRCLWRYKLASLGTRGEFSVPPEESAQDLFSFLTKYTLRLPSSLTIDELRAFRQEAVSRKFRKWFYEALSEARTRSSLTKIDIDELLLRDFGELIDSHTSRLKRVAEIVTATVMAGVGLIVGPAAGIVSALTYPVFRRLVDKAAATWGAQRWIEVLAGFET
jgi:hypothetical protein